MTPTIGPSGPLNSCETVRTPVTKGPPSPAECVATDDPVGPDLSREGPFDACDADQDPRQSPMVLDSMSGCQYRMTPYEDRTNRDDLDPSYGIHYTRPPYDGIHGGARVGSSTRLGRQNTGWNNMGRERTIQAALRLHHDVNLIMTNVQIMSQLGDKFFKDSVGSHEDGV